MQKGYEACGGWILYKFYFGYLQQVLNIGYKYCPEN